MNDIMAELAAVARETGTAPQGRTVVLRRGYPADIADVWDALTTAERIARWFLPISGELTVGGHYQFEGNAGGEVLACEPPSLLRVSWVMDPGAFSEVTVRLTPTEGGTELELTHVAQVPPEFWDRYGPGAVGVGWELGLLGLARYLATGADRPENPDADPEIQALMTGSARAWGEAHRASGVPVEVAEAAAAATAAFYVPR